MIYFVTGNAGKMSEFKAMMPNIEQLELDLEEIQAIDPRTVIEHKLNEATKHRDGELVVDDTSVILKCLGPLPGTFMKWFIKGIGLDGIADLASRYPDQSAIARTTLGYRDQAGKNHFFVGEIQGTIVPPKGEGFGWNSIFVPDGYDQTFAELGPNIKNRISMRRQAIEQLKAFLKTAD